MLADTPLTDAWAVEGVWAGPPRRGRLCGFVALSA